MESTTTNNHHTTTAASAVGAGIRWNSPIPYLFGGIALVLGLITVALIILACTQDKHSEDKEKDDARKSSNVVDDGPKFVVIMAGAQKPTFLAKPVPKTEPEPMIMATTSVYSSSGDEQV